MQIAGFWPYRKVLAASAAIVPVLLAGFAPSADAQFFCPANANGQPGIALNGGFCTNGVTGALSTASLSSQSLSEVTQTTTQQTTSNNLEAVEKRRNEEAQRCPEGFERSGGGCRRTAQNAPARSRTAPGSSQSTMTEPVRTARRTAPAEPAPMLYKAPPMVYDPVRYAVWGQGFGDYERRTGSGVSTSGGIGGGPGPGPGPGGAVSVIPVDLGRTTTTWGFNGGADATYRNVLGTGDIFIAGLLTGYMSSDVSFAATSLKARIDGPSVGGYITYLNGPFSGDLLARVDFLGVHESFSDLLNFNLGVNAGTVQQSGSGSTNLNNYVVAGNLNYRLWQVYAWWIEPTAGFRYIDSAYDSSAAALGLANGHDWRVQGGLRFGTDFYWGATHVTPTLTGLVYDDVEVTGGVVTGGIFPLTPIIPSDQGKVRGQGIFNVNFDYGNGVSAFVQGDVRGGSDLLGGGGRAGIRYQW
jgi:hypothetical protein